MAKPDKSATMTRLHSAARLARTALAARLLDHGFYAGQDQIMLALDHADGQTPGQLAARLGVRPPTITKTINRLQVQGFLEKRASEADARQAHIFLTEAGRDTIRAIEKSVRKTEKQALKGLDRKEQKALSKLLARIEANLLGNAVGLVEVEAEEAE
jgi:DNA-binding MarR family transcriptional regulator